MVRLPPLLSLVLMVVVLILHGYPDGCVHTTHRDSSGCRSRTRYWCPQTEFFLRRIAEAKLKGVAVRNDVKDSTFEFSLLVVGDVGTVRQDALTKLDDEEFWGWQFFQFPTDFFSIKILQVYKFRDKVRISECVNGGAKLYRRQDGEVSVLRRSESRCPHHVQQATRQQPYQPYVTDPSFWDAAMVLLDGDPAHPVPVSQLLHRLGIDPEACLAVPVVQTVVGSGIPGLVEIYPVSGPVVAAVSYISRKHSKEGWARRLRASMPRTRCHVI